MKISEAAAKTDLSADTIRFYERAGLLPDIARSSDGHRAFSGQDLRWLRLFERLRSTQMPLTDMKRYVDMAQMGEGTLTERREMLEKHALALDMQQAKIDACRALLDEKIETYRSLEEARDVGR
ncbi:MAG: MerR family transcriptional regulator [Pseudomonadota bacterium]|nr:MerR family transcriptional regulator [Pseudomonadota bacterium]